MEQSRTNQWLLAAALFAGLAAPLGAGPSDGRPGLSSGGGAVTPVAAGTLEGRIVTFSVLAYDDPEAPLFVGRGQTVQVGRGVEFGLDPEGSQNGLDVVPVEVDIFPTRIELTYREDVGKLFAVTFNGYLLRFETDCALIDRVEVDKAASSVPLTNDAIRSEMGMLYINVSGQHIYEGSTIALDLTVADCPLS